MGATILTTIALLCASGDKTFSRNECQKKLIKCMDGQKGKRTNEMLWECNKKRLGIK